LTLVSSCGVHLKTDQPLDVCHPFGDFRFMRVPSGAKRDELITHQLKYPHDDADLDINVIFPIERLQELCEEGCLGNCVVRKLNPFACLAFPFLTMPKMPLNDQVLVTNW
jgi:D-proline reductase (dithiol) PrdB